MSLDLETTGLIPGIDKIIELGAITKQGQEFHTYVYHDNYTVCGYVAGMHNRIWTELAKVPRDARGTFSQDGVNYCEAELLLPTFHRWIQACGLPWNYTAAGKNVSFDLSFLRALGKSYARVRALDPAILYIEEGDDEIPDLSLCASRIGYQFELHSALEDAKCVRELLLRKGY